MKIIHVLNSLCSGGAEVFVSQLCLKQNEAGHDVMLLTYAGLLDVKGNELSKTLELNGVHQHHLGIRRNWKKWLVSPKFAAVINEFSPDVINVHLPACDFFTAIAIFLTDPLGLHADRISYIRTVHSSQKGEILHPLSQAFINSKYDRVIACSESVMQTTQSGLQIDTFINNGIDLKHLPNLCNIDVLQSDVDIAESVHLVCVGSMTEYMGNPRKGQDLILRAMAEMQDETFSVTFLGDGPLRADLEKLAFDLGVKHQCKFSGRIDDVVKHLKPTDVFILPSLAEGLSIAAIEAACLGLPLVVSDIEAFKPFESGSTLFHKVGKVRSLVQSLSSLKANHGTLIKKAHDHAEIYRSTFALEHVADNYLEEYTKSTR